MLKACSGPVTRESQNKTSTHRWSGDVPKMRCEKENDYRQSVQQTTTSPGSHTATRSFEGFQNLFSDALLDLPVNCRAKRRRKFFIWAKFIFRVDFRKCPQHLVDNVGPNVVALEQDRGITSDGKGKKLGPTGVGIRKLSYIVYLRTYTKRIEHAVQRKNATHTVFGSVILTSVIRMIKFGTHLPMNLGILTPATLVVQLRTIADN